MQNQSPHILEDFLCPTTQVAVGALGVGKAIYCLSPCVYRQNPTGS